MIGRKRKRLGDLLVDAGVVTSEQLGEALKKQRELGLKLGETLIELKFTDENEIVEALHQQMGYPVAKIREAKIAPEVMWFRLKLIRIIRISCVWQWRTRWILSQLMTWRL